MHGVPEGSQLVTRYAPSPTGWLHLGHVANALWTWGTARKLSARVLLRIEDHDRTRCRPEYEEQILADPEWLGFAAEAETTSSLRAGQSPYRQSDSFRVYDAALNRLAEQGLVYGCTCSRSTIAGELGDGFTEGQELTYPGLCREKGIEPGPGVSLRIRLPDTVETFSDLRLGEQQQRPRIQCGDLMARDRNGNWTYQFAVTVDDLRHGVTLVVRGEDLLSSTGRQLALARLLGREEMPRFLHHPIIRNDTGQKLSKRERALGVRCGSVACRPRMSWPRRHHLLVGLVDPQITRIGFPQSGTFHPQTWTHEANGVGDRCDSRAFPGDRVEADGRRQDLDDAEPSSRCA